MTTSIPSLKHYNTALIHKSARTTHVMSPNWPRANPKSWCTIKIKTMKWTHVSIWAWLNHPLVASQQVRGACWTRSAVAHSVMISSREITGWSWIRDSRSRCYSKDCKPNVHSLMNKWLIKERCLPTTQTSPVIGSTTSLTTPRHHVLKQRTHHQDSMPTKRCPRPFHRKRVSEI